MRIFVLSLVCLFLLLAEALLINLFGFDVLMPHLGVGLVIYLGTRSPQLFEAAAVTLILAWGADLLAATPPGTRAMALTVVFFLVRIFGTRLNVDSRVILGMLSVVAAALMMAIEVGIILALTGELSLLEPFLLGALPSSLMAPVGVLVSMVVLSRVEDFFSDRKGGLRLR